MKFKDIPAWSVAVALATFSGIGGLYALAENVKDNTAEIVKNEERDNERSSTQWRSITTIKDALAEQKEINGRIDERTKDMKDDIKTLLREIRADRSR